MNDQEQISDDRELRGEAREVLTERFEGLKTALAEKGIPARARDAALDKAKATGREAVAVARENRGVIGGTLALLALWFLRKPLIEQSRRHLPRLGGFIQRAAKFLDKD